ncbi:MAG: PEP-CTERM sorting domain-containing protein [Phycisphaerales bacterium JB037]
MRSSTTRRAGAIALALTAGLASGQVFYGITFEGNLTQFDMAAQTVTTIGPISVGPTSPAGFQDLAFDGSGNLYALQGQVFTGFPPPPSNNKTYLVNKDTGAAVLQGDMGISGLLHASLGFRSSNSSFYSIRNTNGYLGILDVSTGGFSPVTGSMHGIRNYVEALAIDPTSGLAYSVVNLGSPPPFGSDNFGLLATDLDAGTSSIIGSFGIGTDDAKALRFDNNGVAYTVNYDTGDVYTVNIATGQATFLFAGGAAAVHTTGLAFVPTPGTVGLMALGGLAAASRRRR